MLDGWKRAAVLALVVLALAVYTFARPAPQQSEIDKLEERLQSASVEGFSGPSLQTAGYVRHYAYVRSGRPDELPFARMAEGLVLPSDKRLIAGVLVDPAVAGEGVRPGVRRVARRDLPTVPNRGCAVVNVLYDPREEDLLGAWCNPGRIAQAGTPTRR